MTLTKLTTLKVKKLIPEQKELIHDGTRESLQKVVSKYVERVEIFKDHVVVVFKYLPVVVSLV
jgi:hypothetical protein